MTKAREKISKSLVSKDNSIDGLLFINCGGGIVSLKLAFYECALMIGRH